MTFCMNWLDPIHLGNSSFSEVNQSRCSSQQIVLSLIPDSMFVSTWVNNVQIMHFKVLSKIVLIIVY